MVFRYSIVLLGKGGGGGGGGGPPVWIIIKFYNIIRSDRISMYSKNVQMYVCMFVSSKASNVTHFNQD